MAGLELDTHKKGGSLQTKEQKQSFASSQEKFV